MLNLPRARVALLALAAAAGVACSKTDDTGKPSGVPPLEGPPSPPAAPPPAKPAAAPAPSAPSAPSAAAPPAPAAEAPAPEAPSAPAAAGGSISGEIVLAPARKGDVSPSDIIFVVARRISDNPSARGSLLAVKKLTAASFPIPFTLSAADMPFQNGAFDGDVTISARVDKDGNPITHGKGDVFGVLPKVHVGARNVKLKLDQLQKEDESLAQPGPAVPPGHP